jgi:hypothetical protein
MNFKTHHIYALNSQNYTLAEIISSKPELNSKLLALRRTQAGELTKAQTTILPEQLL